MTILRDLSLIWTMFHVLVLFIFFYESRYDRKKTLILTCASMIPLTIFNMTGVALYGVEFMGKMLILTCTVPSAIFFFIIAKHRNSRFFFTFCLADTLVYEILIFSNLLDTWLPGDRYVVMFLVRLIAYPLLEWFVYRYLRKPYIRMQNQVQHGWGAFSIIGIIYYILLWFLFNYPTVIHERTDQLPALLLVMVLMPITYLGIFFTLQGQLDLADTQQREQSLRLQTATLAQRIDSAEAQREAMRIQRHDMHHRYQILKTMLQNGNTEDAVQYLSESDHTLLELKQVEYCDNPILNAVFAFYDQEAQKKQIRLETRISLPEDLNMDVVELSVVFSNTLENAIHACEGLPVSKRVIQCKCIGQPQFMFRISNPYEGTIKMDREGRPVTDQAGHGSGIRSIVAFCEMYDAYYEFDVKDGWFTFRMTK